MRVAAPHLEALSVTCDVTCFEGAGRMTAAELVSSAAGVDGLLSPANQPIPTELLRTAARLRVISNFGVGYDNVDLAVAAECGILVTNTPGVLSAAVAELTLGLMISLARGLRQAEQVVREGRWGAPGALPLGTDLRGKALGIAGYGRIGREVAGRAGAFGMHVIFFDARPGTSAAAGHRSVDSLAQLLAEADFVTLHTDLNAGSRHLIGADELGLMKHTAYLINTSRGAIVDQGALYEALKGGRIAGAALDVLEREPPDPADPLLQLPNVVVLPHIGSATVETRRAMMELAIENLLACLEGRPCENIVAGG